MSGISETYESVVAGIDQARSILCAIIGNDRFADMDASRLSATLAASENLMAQAHQSMENLWELIKHHSIAEAIAKPVMCCDEPIPDLEKESLALIRELTEQSENVVRLGRALQDAIDKRDKTA